MGGAPGADRRAATNECDRQWRPHGDAPRPHEDARGQGEDRRERPGGHRGRRPHLLVRGLGHGIKVIDDLRDRLPEASKARIVKTTLFKRGLAAAGYGDDVVSQVPALSNMWVFSTTDDMKATVKAFDGWVKDNGLEKPIKGGYFDNDFIDAKGVKKVKDLPTMPDLMLKLCVSLNLAGSLGIAKAVKAAKGNPRQVAVAISKIEELPKTD